MKLVCRQCGTHYEKGKFCLECGSPLEEIQVQKVLYCANCQMVVESGKFCPECGTKLEEHEVEVSTSTNSKSHTVAAMEIETVSTNISSGDEENEAILSKYRDEYGDMRTLNTEEYAVAAEELQKCVDKGNVEAMCFLAILYMDGHGVPKDETVAYNLLRKAEDIGSEYAKVIMGIFYILGIIVQQDTDEALNRLTTGYEKLQIPSIAGHLSHFFYNMEDYKTALKYATEAAEKNDKAGLMILGACYLNGNGVSKNEEKAFEYYIQASAMGEEIALNQIGWMYMNGCGVEEDPSQAFFWYNESANKQSDVGMYNLACCYRDGYGVEQDIEKAAEWYKKAAEAGYLDAMVALGQYYQEHMIDFDKAEKWLLKAAEAGSAEAMNMLGVFYSDTMCDDTSAVKWYKKAVELDQPNAFRNLALCYRDGKGVKKNEKKAEELLKKANELGVDDAKDIHEDMIANNEDQRIDKANEALYAKDYKSAFIVYKELAEKGNVRAIANYGHCLVNGWGIKQNMKEGVNWLTKAAEQGSAWACMRLAEVYLGFEYEKKQFAADAKKAKDYINLARKNGADDSELSNLVKMTTPAAKISNVKYIANCKQSNNLGVEFTFDLNVDGMLGKKVNISAVDTDKDTRKSILNKPCKSLTDPIECIWCERIKVESVSALWKPYKVFIPYWKLCTIKNFKSTIVFTIWDQSEKQPAKLASIELPYELTHTKHLLRTDEWLFVLLSK